MPSVSGTSYASFNFSNVRFEDRLTVSYLVRSLCYSPQETRSLALDASFGYQWSSLSRSRMRMRLAMTRQSVEKSWRCRTIIPADTEALASLMLAAYRETIDYDGETLEDALFQIRGVFQGKFGVFQDLSSFAIEEEGRLLSATIITLWQGRPLVAFSMTRPEFKNMGMATYLLKSSINALLTFGQKELYLMVTDGNEPAQRLCEKVGFQPE
jgi:RimJ/RimL family protein N-acetyltransferase